MTERENLIKVLRHKSGSDKQLHIEDVADFILADRKRIVEPLVKVMLGRIDDNATFDAIQETLKLAGVTP